MDALEYIKSTRRRLLVSSIDLGWRYISDPSKLPEGRTLEQTRSGKYRYATKHNQPSVQHAPDTSSLKKYLADKRVLSDSSPDERVKFGTAFAAHAIDEYEKMQPKLERHEIVANELFTSKDASGNVIGVCHAFINKTGAINVTYIGSLERGTGSGTALMNQLHAWGKEHGASMMTLYSQNDAKEFYINHFGFESNSRDNTLFKWL